MKAVSNAGPLIALGKLGRLDLLLDLFDEVLVPKAVYDEVVVQGLRQGAADAEAVALLIGRGHARVTDVSLPDPLPDWAVPIDLGEVEVIQLASYTQADWAVI